MAGEDQKIPPRVNRPASAVPTVTPAPNKPAVSLPNPKPPSTPAAKPAPPRSTGKFAPVSGPGESAPRPVTSTGKYPPIGVTAPKSAPLNKSGHFSPVGTPQPKPASPAFNRPRTAPGPGASSISQALKPIKPGTRPGGQWQCSSCSKVLGPQSVILGTGILLEGNLICIDCVKGTKRRETGQIMSPKTAVLFGVATLAVLGVVAIFCPGQVLLVLLLLALGALLVGAIGFTLSLRQRLVIFALGILVAAGSAYGIMYLNGRAEERAIREKIAGQADEVKKLLADGYLYEAELRVSAIQEDQLKASNGELSGVAKSALAGLQSICDDWITQNFGKLSEPEIKLLMDFYRQFGSVTPKTRARRLRALKLTDRTAVSVTVAIDPIVPVPPESINREEQFKLSQLTTNDPVEAEAIRLFLAIFKKCPDAESISLKILSGDDNHELFDKTLDRKAILEMRQASSGSMKGGSGRVDPFAGRPANAGSK